MEISEEDICHIIQQVSNGTKGRKIKVKSFNMNKVYHPDYDVWSYHYKVAIEYLNGMKSTMAFTKYGE